MKICAHFDVTSGNIAGERYNIILTYARGCQAWLGIFHTRRKLIPHVAIRLVKLVRYVVRTVKKHEYGDSCTVDSQEAKLILARARKGNMFFFSDVG